MGCWASDDSLKGKADNPTQPLLNQDEHHANDSKTQSLTQNQTETENAKEGYLHDNDATKRWMVLTSRYLYSYQNANDTIKDIEKLDLYVFNKIKPLDDIEHKKQFQFEISSLDDTEHRIFTAESNQDMVDWMHIINKYQSIKVGSLKVKSTKKRWRTCVLLRDSILTFKDSQMSRLKDVFDLSTYGGVVVSGINDNIGEFKLISTQKKDEHHITFTARTNIEMVDWIKHIGVIQDALIVNNYRTMLQQRKNRELTNKASEPISTVTDSAITKSLLCDVESKETDVDIFSATGERCNTIYDCLGIKRIRKWMTLYNKHKDSKEIHSISLTKVIEDAFESKYDIIRILNDYIHIIEKHDMYLEDLCFMDCNINECDAFKRNQRNRMKQYNEDENKSDDTERIVMMDIMDQIHCYLFHTFDTTHRITKDERTILKPYTNKDNINNAFNKMREILSEKRQRYSVNQEEDRIKYNRFSTITEGKQYNNKEDRMKYNRFSYRFDYWRQNSELSVLSKYSTLKDELTSTTNICAIAIDSWNHTYTKASKFQQTNYAKALLAKEDDIYGYGISQYTTIPVNNLIVIIFYTDFNELSFKIKETFKKEALVDTVQQHSHYYWFCKILRETVELYGKDFEGLYNGHSLYHNISNSIHFGSTTITFHQPISSTTHMIVAQRFAIDCGYMLQFDSNSREIFLDYFSSAWISSFANENETILVGGLVPVMIVNIVSYSNGEEYRIYLSALHQISQCLDGYGPRNLTRTDTDILDVLLFGDYMSFGIPIYFVNIFETFLKKTKKIKIGIEHICRSSYFSSLLLLKDEENQPFINLDNIQRQFCNIEEIVIYPGYKRNILLSTAYFCSVSSSLIKCDLSSLETIKICNVKLHNNSSSFGDVVHFMHSVKNRFEELTDFDLDLKNNDIFITANSSTVFSTASFKQQKSQITVIY